MATSGSFTIGGTSPDYSTIQAWGDSPTGDLTGIYDGLIRAGTYVENIQIDHAHATTSAFYMRLGPDTGAHHGGRPGAGVDVIGGTTLNDHIFNISVDFTRVKGINAGKMLGQSSESFRIAADGVYIEECIGLGGTTYDSDFCNLVCPANSTVRIANNLIIGMSRAAVIIQASNSSGLTLYCYNNTAIYCGLPENDDDLTGFGSENTAPASARTLVLKNNYCHATNTNRTVTCYAKIASDSWGASVDNASSDGTAPGTSPLTSVALTSFQQPPINETIGENTGDDYSGTTEACTLNKDLATTNKTDALVLRHNGTETPDQIQSVLYRCDMTNFPAATRVYFAGVQFELAAADNGPAGTAFLSNRNWVESEATWNLYSTGNSWASVGSLGAADLLAGSNGNLIADPDSGSYAGEAYRTSSVTASDKWTFSCHQLNQWVEAAIQGTGGSPKGVNWLDLVIHRDGGSVDANFTMDSPEDADGNKPFVQVIYETADTILDLHPTSASVLDGVGTDLSADGDFAITTDLTGATRIDTSWDIGALQLLSEGTFTIGGTLPDYATPQAWADSPQANLTGIYKGLMRAGVYAPVDIDIGASGYTTGSTAYMHLTADIGADHLGVFGDGAIIEGDGTLQANVVLQDDWTRVTNIESRRPSGKSAECFYVAGDEGRIERCLIYDANNYQSDGIYIDPPDNSTFYFSQNVIAFIGRKGVFIQGAAVGVGLTVYGYNNTWIYGGGQASVEGAEAGYEAEGAPTTARTHHLINNYIHVEAGIHTNVCFVKDAADSWGTSKNNASSDGTAPGTSPQTSAAIGSQFTQMFIQDLCGENSGDDVSATTEACTLDKNNTTTNVTNELEFEFRGDESPTLVQNPLIRFNLVNAATVNLLVSARIILNKKSGTGTNLTGAMYQMARNWVEAQATWNLYSTGNSWGTAGAINASDVLANGETEAADPSAQGSNSRCYPVAADPALTNGDDIPLSCSKLSSWVQAVIAGAGPSPKGSDWLDVGFYCQNGNWDIPNAFDSAEGSDGNRPKLEIFYDTSGSPADLTPIATGVLDSNGVDVGADVNYAIGDVDIAGIVRDDWAIGAYTMGALVADGFDIGDSATEALIVKPSVADGVDIGDTGTMIATYVPAGAEGVDLGDSAVAVVIKPEPGVDGVDLGDTATVAIVKVVAGVDGVDLGDSAPAPLVRPHSTLIIRGP